MKEVKLNSYDDTVLYCRLFDEVENPKGVVQIVHGMGEHSGRYAHFAEFLNKNGYVAFGDDHRGHGFTETDENRGNHEGNMFHDTVKDELFIYSYLKDAYNLPVIMVGHSCGSFLAQSFLQQQTDIAGVALTGSGVMSGLKTGAGIGLASFIAIFNKKARLNFLNKAGDIIYKPKYNGADDIGKKLWLTRDGEFRKISINDPMSGVPMSVSFVRDMLKGVRDAAKDENLKKLNRDTPIGIFSGNMDPIGDFGKGVVKLRERYEKYGVKHIDYHVYDGARHEVLNEINRDEVMRDILHFLDNCVGISGKGE